MKPKPTIDDIRNRFFGTSSQSEPSPARLVINLPKRYCANAACRRELPLETPRNHTTCSWRCYQVVKAEEAEVEAADKQEVEQPF